MSSFAKLHESGDLEVLLEKQDEDYETLIATASYHGEEMSHAVDQREQAAKWLDTAWEEEEARPLYDDDCTPADKLARLKDLFNQVSHDVQYPNLHWLALTKKEPQQ